MNAKDFQILYEYNCWANACVLDAVAKLTAEQFTRDLSGSFASVRSTLVHIMGAEWVWLQRWKGTSPKKFYDPPEFPNTAALRAHWTKIENEQMEFIKNLTDELLPMKISYINFKGENWTYALWQMLQHLVNHSTYHRGQVATMMRQLGATPAATDFLLFFDKKI
jgi:uncharacterized damage-inducible protein DinB